jgi:hypothetical protein
MRENLSWQAQVISLKMYIEEHDISFEKLKDHELRQVFNIFTNLQYLQYEKDCEQRSRVELNRVNASWAAKMEEEVKLSKHENSNYQVDTTILKTHKDVLSRHWNPYCHNLSSLVT